jgi:type I restriction enzyme S subunit
MFAYNPSRINVGSIAWNKEDHEIAVSPMYVVFKIDPERVLPEYLMLFLDSPDGKQQILDKCEVGARFRLPFSSLSKISLSLPPLRVQQEIVTILNKFTSLGIELAAELEVRKDQYQDYRHKLLSCEGMDFEELELGSFGRVLMCKRIMKDETAAIGEVPFYKIGTFGGKPDAVITQDKFEEFKSKFSFPRVGSLLISAAGTIGKIVRYKGEPSYFQDSNIVWLDHDESVVLNEYLFHCYSIAKWSTDTGSIPRLYNSNILKLKVKVPSLKEQKRIATILGQFETLTNDPILGIPAEITARHQQYEYYRNKLLTFKDMEVA